MPTSLPHPFSAGETGFTELPEGLRLTKGDVIFDALGSLDELMAALGLMRSACGPSPAADWLESLQRDVLEIGAEMAGGTSRLKESAVARIAAETKRLEATRPPARSFVLPGASEISARAHLARTICRRAERDLVRAKDHHSTRVTPLALAYLNRLSGLLFALARSE